MPSFSSTLARAGVVVIMLTSIILFWSSDTTKNDDAISVAFLGNSFTFVNDLPRVMGALSEGKTRYDDKIRVCTLYGALAVTSLLNKGNGMYNWWGNSNFQNNNNGDDATVSLILEHVPSLNYFWDTTRRLLITTRNTTQMTD